MIMSTEPGSAGKDETRISYSRTADIPGTVREAGGLRLLGSKDPRWAAWLEQYDSPGTRDGYARDAGQWAAWLAARGVDLYEATDADLSSYVAALRDRQLSTSAAARKVAAVCSFYGWAARRYLVPAKLEPDRRPRVHTDPVRRLGLPTGEVAALLEEAKPGLELALTSLLARTGARVSEITASDVEHVHRVQGRRVLYITGKGRKQRTPPLTDEAWAPVVAYLDGRTTGPLLLGVRGGRLSRQRAWEIVRALGQRIGVRVHPHLFRHFAATALARAGYSIKQIAVLLGHEDISTTGIYLEGLAALDDSPAYGLSELLAGARAELAGGAQ